MYENEAIKEQPGLGRSGGPRAANGLGSVRDGPIARYSIYRSKLGWARLPASTSWAMPCVQVTWNPERVNDCCSLLIIDI